MDAGNAVDGTASTMADDREEIRKLQEAAAAKSAAGDTEYAETAQLVADGIRNGEL